MSRQEQFVQALRDWDNQYNKGILQKGKFHVYNLRTPNKPYYEPGQPYPSDEEYVDFDTHMNRYMHGFADLIPDIPMNDVIGYALDRLLDHLKDFGLLYST